MRQRVCSEKKSRHISGAKAICNWRESGLRATLFGWSPPADALSEVLHTA